MQSKTTNRRPRRNTARSYSKNKTRKTSTNTNTSQSSSSKKKSFSSTRSKQGANKEGAQKRSFKKPIRIKRRSGGRTTTARRNGNRNARAQRGGQRSGGIRTRSGRRIPTFDPTTFIKESRQHRNTAPEKEEVYEAKNTFETFGLSAALTATIKEMGLVTPSPIQDQIIPEILAGNDVIGLAETGTGKTAAFLIPVLEKTISEPDAQRMTLILTPTRELAIQIEGEFRKLAKGLDLYATICVGGTAIEPQIARLKRRNHFIIGTPGRVLDLIQKKHIRPHAFTTVILDEADQMLDMGFINDIKAILRGTPEERETLFFSATSTPETDAIVHDFLRDPVTISVKKRDVTSQVIQDIVSYTYDAKFDTLTDLLRQNEYKKVLIFGAMKHSVKQLAESLHQAGIKAESIHGNKTHHQRQRSLNAFKKGEVHVLVATDVAARGIHVDNVSHVINYDLPATFQDYVHRIGRTGRGHNKGKALTFVEGR